MKKKRNKKEKGLREEIFVGRNFCAVCFGG